MNFKVDIHQNASNNLFIQIKDQGFEIVDNFKKIKNPQIVIKNGDDYIASTTQYMSISTKSIEGIETIKHMLEVVYKDKLLIYNYCNNERHYLFTIYKTTLRQILSNCVLNNEILKLFVDNNIYICVSSRFDENTITNKLNEESVNNYSILDNSYYNYNDVSSETTTISNLQLKFNLQSKYNKPLNNLIKNKVTSDDLYDIQDLLKYVKEKKIQISIIAENGISYSMKDILELMREFINNMKNGKTSFI